MEFIIVCLLGLTTMVASYLVYKPLPARKAPVAIERLSKAT